MVVHLKSFDGLIILNDWVEGLFLQLLPVLAKVIFGVGIEQKKEVFNIRDHFFEAEIVPSRIQLEGLFLELSD